MYFYFEIRAFYGILSEKYVHFTPFGLCKEDYCMKTSYKKLWKLLIDREMTKTELCQKSGISPSSMAKLTKGECVTTKVLLKICSVLKCDIGDIVEVASDTGSKHNDY